MILQKKRKAFTLAEILITLGIIGVISAMTIPSLLTNINSKKFKSIFKKDISTLTQMVKLAEANDGVNFATNGRCWPTPGGGRYGANDKASVNKTFCAIFNSYLKSPLENYTFAQNTRWRCQRCVVAGKTWNMLNRSNVYVLPEGSMVTFDNQMVENECSVPVGEHFSTEWIEKHPDCKGLIDVNGFAPPNKEVVCTTGTTSADIDADCTVTKSSDLSDVYPIVFHDSIVEPGSNAAKYVLTH